MTPRLQYRFVCGKSSNMSGLVGLVVPLGLGFLTTCGRAVVAAPIGLPANQTVPARTIVVHPSVRTTLVFGWHSAVLTLLRLLSISQVCHLAGGGRPHVVGTGRLGVASRWVTLLAVNAGMSFAAVFPAVFFREERGFSWEWGKMVSVFAPPMAAVLLGEWTGTMAQSRTRSETFARASLRSLVTQLVGRWPGILLAAAQCAVSFGVMIYLQAWDAMVLNAVLLFLLVTDLLPVNARWEAWNELTQDTKVVAFRSNMNIRLADDPQCAVLVTPVEGRLEYVGIRQPALLERSRVLDWWQQVTASGPETTALVQPESGDPGKGVLTLLGAHSDNGRWICDNGDPVEQRHVVLVRLAPDEEPVGPGALSLPVYGTPQFHAMLHVALQLQDHSTGASNADYCRETFLFHSHLLGELSSWYSDGEPDGREGNGFGGAAVRPAGELLNVGAPAATDHVVTYAQGLALWQEPQRWNAWVVAHIANDPQYAITHEMADIVDRLRPMRHEFASGHDSHLLAGMLSLMSTTGRDMDESWTTLAKMVDHPRLELLNVLEDADERSARWWWRGFLWLPTLPAYLGYFCLWRACRSLDEAAEDPASEAAQVVRELWKVGVTGIRQGLHLVTVPIGDTVQTGTADSGEAQLYYGSHKEPGVLAASLLSDLDGLPQAQKNRHRVLSDAAARALRRGGFPDGLEASTLTPALADRDGHTGMALAYELFFRLSTAQAAYSFLIALKEIVGVL